MFCNIPQKDQTQLGFPLLLHSIRYQLAITPLLSHGLGDLLALVSQASILHDAEHFRYQIPWVETTFSISLSVDRLKNATTYS